MNRVFKIIKIIVLRTVLAGSLSLLLDYQKYVLYCSRSLFCRKNRKARCTLDLQF
jgi:hypothetical protein